MEEGEKESVETLREEMKLNHFNFLAFILSSLGKKKTARQKKERKK